MAKHMTIQQVIDKEENPGRYCFLDDADVIFDRVDTTNPNYYLLKAAYVHGEFTGNDAIVGDKGHVQKSMYKELMNSCAVADGGIRRLSLDYRYGDVMNNLGYMLLIALKVLKDDYEIIDVHDAGARGRGNPSYYEICEKLCANPRFNTDLSRAFNRFAKCAFSIGNYTTPLPGQNSAKAFGWLYVDEWMQDWNLPHDENWLWFSDQFCLYLYWAKPLMNETSYSAWAQATAIDTVAKTYCDAAEGFIRMRTSRDLDERVELLIIYLNSVSKCIEERGDCIFKRIQREQCEHLRLTY